MTFHSRGDLPSPFLTAARVILTIVFGAHAVSVSFSAPGTLPLHRLSSGALLLLDRKGELVRPARPLPEALTADESIAAKLNPRVGPNVRLGQDPSALPISMRAQAEPHVVRSLQDPDLLLATFQEGRFAGPGAITCGYAVSRDGGLTWLRSLVPALTTLNGGTFFRATDPVAAFDGEGRMYLNTLAALDARFDTSVLLVSRSTNSGVTFESPVEITRSPTSGILVDKNWIAVNTFPGTATYGRIVSTFTRFDLNGYPLAIAHSDDQGSTWSPWRYITPTPYYGQGTQPVFLPDGTLAVVHWNFAGPAIEVRTSADGGLTFGFSNRVTQVASYSSPAMRDGSFLPSAAGNRSNNTLYVTYQALHLGSPRIMFTLSTNAGVTWSTPVAVSDNPSGSQVCNPAISASPDGSLLSVVFYDGRQNPTNDYLVDLYLASSVDGGRTWAPNLRLSTATTDIRNAPLTGSGYMVGDYMGVAPAIAPNVPAVAVYVDARADPDPYAVRVALAERTSYGAWATARFSHREITSTTVSSPGTDPDGDGNENVIEYGFGLNPRIADAPQVGALLDPSTGVFAMKRQVVAEASDLIFRWESSTDLADWMPSAPWFQRYERAPGAPVGTWTDLFEAPLSPLRFYRVSVGFRNP